MVGVPSAEWGETVVAFVVGRQDPDLPALRELAAAGAGPVQVSARAGVVDALPRNAMGKVVAPARLALRDPGRAGCGALR